MNVRGAFLGSFRWRIGKWLRSLKLQTCKDHAKIKTIEYLAWFMENILGSRLRGITVWKTCTYAGSKVSYTCRSWLRGIRGLRVCNLFIHVI